MIFFFSLLKHFLLLKNLRKWRKYSLYLQFLQGPEDYETTDMKPHDGKIPVRCQEPEILTNVTL